MNWLDKNITVSSNNSFRIVNTVFYLLLSFIYHKMSYSLVMILELDSVSEVQYKEIMIISNK